MELRKRKKRGAVVYIGPSLKGLVKHTVFLSGDYTAPVKSLIEKYPNIAHLMVPVEGLQQARKDVNRKGHILNFYLTNLFRSKE